jgi:pilus assembly protein Flp/PilA
MSPLARFLTDDDATTAVEYSVLLALIILTCITAISALGSASGGMWGGNKAKLDAVGF